MEQLFAVTHISGLISRLEAARSLLTTGAGPRIEVAFRAEERPAVAAVFIRACLHNTARVLRIGKRQGLWCPLPFGVLCLLAQAAQPPPG